MPGPKLLIEQWLPIEAIGAECMRERGASSALPPLYFLHVWWARRPLTVSRAAILASLLPAFPSDEDQSVPTWPERFHSLFPSFDAYKAWFLRLIGILGDPVAGRKLLQWAGRQGKPIPNPYGYPRAFSVNPKDDQLSQLYDILEWTWGTREIAFCDPMSGGGSIPFEALRYGLSVTANELNPVASIVLKATLDFPARFGPDLATDIQKYGKIWSSKVKERLKPFFSETEDRDLGACYVWARTIACPETGKPVPLSPNWWLRKTADPTAVRVVTDANAERCKFEIVRGTAACKNVDPDKGTIKRGTGLSPWTGSSIPGDYIKAEAKAGRMGQQLYAVGLKRTGGFVFRPPTEVDEAKYASAEAEVQRLWASWNSQGLIPNELRSEGRADWACQIYGEIRWSDTYSPRHLLSMITLIECFRETLELVRKEIPEDRQLAVTTLMAVAIDIAADYNSKQTYYESTRDKIAHAFQRHDLSMRWSFSEFDASGNLVPWVCYQIEDAYKKLAKLSFCDTKTFFGGPPSPAIDRLRITNGGAQSLSTMKDGELHCICVDPPYYDNVMYAECSNYFYVWLKRTVGEFYPDLFSGELANAEDEAVMNVARFKALGKKAKALATADYENKMMACFKEMSRVLHPNGVLTVMFTHKQIQAWDTLGSALMRAGFRIDASWPVHTESETSLHQAKKNAAASTILLACRKREVSNESAWWDDLKGKVRETARTTAERFEKDGIKGVDLYISTFGPVLSIISERWPVLTSETDPKTGDPLPLQPGEALDLARQEVVNLRKQGLLLGRTVEFDPVTDWYLLAWDAFRAQEFPADEARRLALALGLDLEAQLVKEQRLVTKKGKNVTLSLPIARRKKGMVDPETEGFPHLIDALHTAMMVYEEDGSRSCQVFVDRHGLRNDARIKALVQAAMQAIPTTRGKDGRFLRPEMATLDAMRLLLWDDLPAPPEEEAPKLDAPPALKGMPADILGEEEVIEGDDLEDEVEDEEEAEDD